MADYPKGVAVRKNIKNEYTYLRIHWSADPSRDDEWKRKMIALNGERDFAISHDLQRVQMGGKGVFSDMYDPAKHDLTERREPDPRFGPVILGWDFGGDHSVIVGQRQGKELVLFQEYVNLGFGTKDIARDIYGILQAQWPQMGTRYVDAIDPAGKDAGKETEAKSCADYLVAQALSMGRTRADVLAPPNNLLRPRLEAVRKVLRGDEFLLKICPDVITLKRALAGGYCWSEKKGQGQSAKPEKNSYSHISDSCQYLCYIAHKLKVGNMTARVISKPFYFE